MITNLRTIKQLVQENPAFTEGGIRWQLFNAQSNGLSDSGAIVRVGRRIYIDINRYYDWLTKDVNLQQAS